MYGVKGFFYVERNYGGEFFSFETAKDCVCDFTELLRG